MIGLLGSDDFVVHTITSDNGKEFATHMHVARALCLLGLTKIERMVFAGNTLTIRQVTDAEISALQDRLNARPKGIGIQDASRSDVRFGDAPLITAIIIASISIAFGVPWNFALNMSALLYVMFYKIFFYDITGIRF